MQEEVRRQLREIVARYGREVAGEPRRVRALLLDLCGEHRPEVRILALAAEERVAAELAAPPPGVPPELLLARLARRLVDDCMLNEEAARWAVETWALALGINCAPLQPASTAPKPTPPVSKPAPTPSAPKPTPPAPAYTAPPQAGRSAQDFGALVEIPAGPFLMGSDKSRDPKAFDSELPQHRVTLPRYWIGRAPVTVAQFRAFVQASAYKWEGAEKKQGGADHPVVYVSWYDALAYCDWLTRQVQAGDCSLQIRRSGRLEPLNLQPTSLAVRLPTEAEWEKAARGINGRIYPWGDEEPNGRFCNFHFNSVVEVGTTTPVSKYSPWGDSPYGCVDMAGNVCEWTSSLWGKEGEEPEFKYPYTPTDGREDLWAGSDMHRVLRGGAFDTLGGRSLRCADRDWNDPDVRYDNFGFRVVASPINSGL